MKTYNKPVVDLVALIDDTILTSPVEEEIPLL